MEAATDRYAVRIDHVAKSFAGSRVLREVSFAVRRGEIHALLGANGSGKSTLLKILAGIYRGDRGGSVVVYDRPIAAHRTNPSFARAAGLRFVHQDLAVFPSLSVAENVAVRVGYDTSWPSRIDRRRLARRVEDLLERFDITATPEMLMCDLAPPDRAMLVAAATLHDTYDGLRTFVLDEATATLPAAESHVLYEAMRRRADEGHSVLLVTHRLDEAAAVADAATVLRDGAVSGTLKRDELHERRLAELIVGRSVDDARRPRPVHRNAVVLEARGLSGGPVRDVNFALHRGEVLGIAGPIGAGRSELLQMLFGARRIRAGTLLLDGEPVRLPHVAAAMRAGIAYVPSDRSGSVFPTLSLSENLAAAHVASGRDRFRLYRRREEGDAAGTIATLAIRSSSPRQLMTNLSGGDQQKVVLARWLARHPRVLLLDQPTSGIDVGARRRFQRLVSDAVAQGGAALIVSDDFDELARLADRVLVMQGGRVVTEVATTDIDASALAALALGALMRMG